MYKKGTVFIQGEDKSSIYKPLTDPYRRPPKDFPKKIGVLVYNKDFDSLEKEYPDILSITTLGRIEMANLKKLFEDKNHFSIFKEIVDRAIRREKPTETDKKLLRRAFESGLEVIEKEENNCWFPVVIPTNWLYKGKNPRKLLFQWVNYVWRGTIKIKRCEAEGCNRIFIPYPNTPIKQKYCSNKCKNRMAKRRYRQKKKLLSSENKKRD